MKTHILRSGVALAVACFWITPLRAQWAVVDVDAIAQLTKEVSQGAQQIQTMENQYNQMKAMAQRMYGLGRYRSPANIFQAVQYADQYATLARWTSCETTGQNCDPLILDDTSVAAKANDFLSNMASGMVSSTRAMYSTQQIMDGNNLAAIRAVGQIRNAQSQYEAAISALETDDEEDDDAAQAQLAVEQRTSNTAIVQARMTKDTNQLLASMVDQMVAQSKLQRDGLAQSGNDIIDMEQSFSDYTPTYAGAADSWMNWKPPI